MSNKKLQESLADGMDEFAATLTHAMKHGIGQVITSVLLRPHLYRALGDGETTLPEELAALGFLPEPVRGPDDVMFWDVTGLGMLNCAITDNRAPRLGVVVPDREQRLGFLIDDIIKATEFVTVREWDHVSNKEKAE